MRIIPVIDLLDGKVVQAVAGRREEYKPVESVLTKNSDPLKTALAFRNLGLEELYIADLDAVCSKGNNSDLVGRIRAMSGMELMVDAGFRNVDEVTTYIGKGIDKIVLATETLESLEKFKEMRKAISSCGLSVVVSIDFKGEKMIGSPRLRMPLAKLIRKFEENGASEIIVLSLDRVGTFQGPDHGPIRKVLSCARVPVLIGGGIRNIDDVRHLQKLGAAGVLLATALHKGMITKKEIDQFRHQNMSLISSK